MTVQQLSTRISLPPGLLAPQHVRELLQLVFGQFLWFKPAKYGFSSIDKRIDTGRINYDDIVSYYEDIGAVCVASSREEQFLWIHPTQVTQSPYTGRVTWVSRAGSASQDSWRVAHAQQVNTLMALLNAPLAISALEADIKGKTQRRVHDGLSEVLTFTVRGYSEGLAGLFWRNFYGPPFVRLFGERLGSLPPECVTRLGEELVLVQPYELPTEAGTEAARAREQQLISLLGPECFYDHEHHRPPTRRPVLEPPPGSDP